jgi:hypothetical protein
MITTAARRACAVADGCGPVPGPPAPVAVTVTIASTSRPPSGRCSFWWTSTAKRTAEDLQKLATNSAPPRTSGVGRVPSGRYCRRGLSAEVFPHPERARRFCRNALGTVPGRGDFVLVRP